MIRANYKCPRCNGRLAPVDGGGGYECDACDGVVTEADYIDETAAQIRGAGFDDLAEKLEATAERAREVVADE